MSTRVRSIYHSSNNTATAFRAIQSQKSCEVLLVRRIYAFQASHTLMLCISHWKSLRLQNMSCRIHVFRFADCGHPEELLRHSAHCLRFAGKGCSPTRVSEQRKAGKCNNCSRRESRGACIQSSEQPTTFWRSSSFLWATSLGTEDSHGVLAGSSTSYIALLSEEVA